MGKVEAGSIDLTTSKHTVIRRSASPSNMGSYCTPIDQSDCSK